MWESTILVLQPHLLQLLQKLEIRKLNIGWCCAVRIANVVMEEGTALPGWSEGWHGLQERECRIGAEKEGERLNVRKNGTRSSSRTTIQLYTLSCEGHLRKLDITNDFWTQWQFLILLGMRMKISLFLRMSGSASIGDTEFSCSTKSHGKGFNFEIMLIVRTTYVYSHLFVINIFIYIFMHYHQNSFLHYLDLIGICFFLQLPLISIMFN